MRQWSSTDGKDRGYARREVSSLATYKAGYKFVDGSVHRHRIDFLSVISCGTDLEEARRMLASARLDRTSFSLDIGEALPEPQPLLTDPAMDIEEPIHLRRSA